MIRTHLPLECSHLESGACAACLDPIRHRGLTGATFDNEGNLKKVGRIISTRLASIRKDTKLAPKTDPILKMFMKANEPERTRASRAMRHGRIVTARDFLFT